jgi:hypothetical protein
MIREVEFAVRVFAEGGDEVDSAALRLEFACVVSKVRSLTVFLHERPDTRVLVIRENVTTFQARDFRAAIDEAAGNGKPLARAAAMLIDVDRLMIGIGSVTANGFERRRILTANEY